MAKRGKIKVEPVTAPMASWKSHYPNKGVDPTVAHLALEKIRAADPNGEILPRKTWMASRRTSHALHPLFEWNDAECGKQHRDEQARGLIRALRIEVEEVDTPPFRAYLNVNSGNKRVYKPTRQVLADPELAAEAVQTFLDELNALRRRHHHIIALKEAIEKIDEIINDLK